MGSEPSAQGGSKHHGSAWPLTSKAKPEGARPELSPKGPASALSRASPTLCWHRPRESLLPWKQQDA